MEDISILATIIRYCDYREIRNIGNTCWTLHNHCNRLYLHYISGKKKKWINKLMAIDIVDNYITFNKNNNDRTFRVNLSIDELRYQIMVIKPNSNKNCPYPCERNVEIRYEIKIAEYKTIKKLIYNNIGISGFYKKIKDYINTRLIDHHY